MGWDCISERLPLTDILFIPQMIYGYGERRWNDTDRGKPKNSEKNLSQWRFVHSSPLSFLLLHPLDFCPLQLLKHKVIVVGYVNFRAVGSQLDVAVTHDGFGCVSVHCARWTGPFREVKSRNPLADGGPRLVLPASTMYIVIHIMTKLLEVKNVGHKLHSLSLCVVVQFVTLL
jgi:hypothetical protein